MTSKEDNVRIFRAMRHRNSGVSRPCNRRRNPGNDFEREAGIDDRLGFLGAAAENKRIAAF